MSTDIQNNTTNHETNPDRNQAPELNDDELNYDHTYKPWNNVIRGRCTCTANVYNIQKQLIDGNNYTNQ